MLVPQRPDASCCRVRPGVPHMMETPMPISLKATAVFFAFVCVCEGGGIDTALRNAPPHPLLLSSRSPFQLDCNQIRTDATKQGTCVGCGRGGGAG